MSRKQLVKPLVIGSAAAAIVCGAYAAVRKIPNDPLEVRRIEAELAAGKNQKITTNMGFRLIHSPDSPLYKAGAQMFVPDPDDPRRITLFVDRGLWGKQSETKRQAYLGAILVFFDLERLQSGLPLEYAEKGTVQVIDPKGKWEPIDTPTEKTLGEVHKSLVEIQTHDEKPGDSNPHDGPLAIPAQSQAPPPTSPTSR